MKYLITVKNVGGVRTFSAIGDIGPLVDAEYDAGALTIVYLVVP